MIVLVAAPPSPNAPVLLDAVRTVMAGAGGAFDCFRASTVNELKTAWTSRQGGGVLLFADYPDAALSALLAGAGIPVIALAEAPGACVQHLTEAFGLDHAAAIRQACASYAALHDLVAGAPRVLLVSGAATTEEADLHSRIACFLDLPAPAPCEPHGAPPARSLRTASQAPHGLNEACDLALEPLAVIAHGRRVESATWPCQMFDLAAPMGGRYDAPIELAGPARTLVYGPYLHLPKGDWSATGAVTVTENHSGNAIAVDVVAGSAILVEAETMLPAAGRHEFTTCFLVEEPRAPLQLRFRLLEGAIEGTFALSDVRLSRA